MFQKIQIVSVSILYDTHDMDVPGLDTGTPQSETSGDPSSSNSNNGSDIGTGLVDHITIENGMYYLKKIYFMDIPTLETRAGLLKTCDVANFATQLG